MLRACQTLLRVRLLRLCVSPGLNTLRRNGDRPLGSPLVRTLFAGMVTLVCVSSGLNKRFAEMVTGPSGLPWSEHSSQGWCPSRGSPLVRTLFAGMVTLVVSPLVRTLFAGMVTLSKPKENLKGLKNFTRRLRQVSEHFSVTQT